MVQIYITAPQGLYCENRQCRHRRAHSLVGECTLMFKKYNVELWMVWGMSDTKVFKGCPSHKFQFVFPEIT